MKIGARPRSQNFPSSLPLEQGQTLLLVHLFVYEPSKWDA
jgi:hypothetical protein